MEGSLKRLKTDRIDLYSTASIRMCRWKMADVAEGYKAMDERRAIKTMLRAKEDEDENWTIRLLA